MIPSPVLGLAGRGSQSILGLDDDGSPTSDPPVGPGLPSLIRDVEAENGLSYEWESYIAGPHVGRFLLVGKVWPGPRAGLHPYSHMINPSPLIS